MRETVLRLSWDPVKSTRERTPSASYPPTPPPLYSISRVHVCVCACVCKYGCAIVCVIGSRGRLKLLILEIPSRSTQQTTTPSYLRTLSRDVFRHRKNSQVPMVNHAPCIQEGGALALRWLALRHLLYRLRLRDVDPLTLRDRLQFPGRPHLLGCSTC